MYDKKIHNNKIKIETISIQLLNENNWNPNEMDKKIFKALRKNINKFGFIDLPQVRKKGDKFEIINGAHRVRAAREEGLANIPCVVVEVSDAEAKLLTENLNRIKGTHNPELEAKLIDELVKEFGKDEILDLTIFDEKELEELGNFELDKEVEEVEVNEDVEPVVKLGDVWLLGEHRLVCGDATNEEDVAKLMNGNKADLVLTDPPYGMNAVKNSGVLKDRYKNIIGDENTDIAIKSVKLLKNYAENHIWFGANYYANCLPNMSHWIVWDKNNGLSDQMDCELAWTNLKGVTRKFTLSSEKVNRVHPTQKPVKLMAWCINKVKCNSVLDVFGGSGSTLIAAEQLNRKCYMMELDPHYCDVIIDRWMRLTGKTAQRLTGE